MNPFQLKIVFAVAWCSALLVGGVVTGLGSMSAWTTLAVVAVGGPLTLMYFMNAPPPSTSEDIQKVLR